jgi:hypothetical protein
MNAALGLAALDELRQITLDPLRSRRIVSDGH